jgi:2-dehydro-3-deoxygluconokinase
MPGLHVLDRIGSGDGFAAGLIHGLLGGAGLERALAYGTAHGALIMTTPGDVSMASLAEVEALMAGGSAHVRR